MERAPLDLIGDEGVRQRQNLDQIMLHRIEPLRPSRRGRRRLSESESPIGGSIKRKTGAWLAGRGEGRIRSASAGSRSWYTFEAVDLLDVEDVERPEHRYRSVLFVIVARDALGEDDLGSLVTMAWNIKRIFACVPA